MEQEERLRRLEAELERISNGVRVLLEAQMLNLALQSLRPDLLARLTPEQRVEMERAAEKVLASLPGTQAYLAKLYSTSSEWVN